MKVSCRMKNKFFAALPFFRELEGGPEKYAKFDAELFGIIPYFTKDLRFRAALQVIVDGNLITQNEELKITIRHPIAFMRVKVFEIEGKIRYWLARKLRLPMMMFRMYEPYDLWISVPENDAVDDELSLESRLNFIGFLAIKLLGRESRGGYVMEAIPSYRTDLPVPNLHGLR